jgi:c(7)-type cytochrome triheme protein
MKRVKFLLVLAMLSIILPAQCLGDEFGDIKFKRKSDAPGEYPPAIFPHWLHRMQFRCYVCHDDITKMKAGSNPITMDAIEGGKFCGACHNGKIAFGVVFEACPRCHRP